MGTFLRRIEPGSTESSGPYEKTVATNGGNFGLEKRSSTSARLHGDVAPGTNGDLGTSEIQFLCEPRRHGADCRVPNAWSIRTRFARAVLAAGRLTGSDPLKQRVPARTIALVLSSGTGLLAQSCLAAQHLRSPPLLPQSSASSGNVPLKPGRSPGIRAYLIEAGRQPCVSTRIMVKIFAAFRAMEPITT
jgi:hypothetical protein